MRTATCAVIVLLCAATLPAQQKKPAPPMRVNILNVCTPGAEEQKEMAAALARVPSRPVFAADFEITRGHSTVEGAASNWVRIRREYPKSVPLLAAQFVFAVEGERDTESLVFYSREAKDVMQVALEDEVTAAGTSPGAVLAADTPVSHIRVERFGKTSLVLARCPNVNQTAYQALFRGASQIMATYRSAMNARQIVPDELARLSGGRRPPKIKPMQKR